MLCSLGGYDSSYMWSIKRWWQTKLYDPSLTHPYLSMLEMTVMHKALEIFGFVVIVVFTVVRLLAADRDWSAQHRRNNCKCGDNTQQQDVRRPRW